jgi:hypothetical protein
VIGIADHVIILEDALDGEGGVIKAGEAGMVVALRGIDGVIVHMDTGETYTGEPRRTEVRARQVRVQKGGKQR